MHCITPNRRTLVGVEVVDFEKRRVPSKHYVYIINVSWNDGSETVIYRRYSMFFDFQIILLETFPWEGGLKEPSARSIPFLPGKILFRRSHIRDVAQKRLKPINEYCKAIAKLPKHISHCDHVLDFFETRSEDVNPVKEDSRRRRKDDSVGRMRSQSLRIIRPSRSLEVSEISGPMVLEPYVAVADYNSTQQKELSLYVGQKLDVIEKNENGWWFVSNDEGERGWVPGVYLEKSDGTAEDLITKQADLGQGEQYVTTHAYTAENSDEISFGAGVVVEVLQKNLEGWWLISYNGKQGNAPASYMEKQQNWSLPNKVEIISSIHDLKHRHSLPSSTLSSVSIPGQNVNTEQNSFSGASTSQLPASPLSPSYKKTVQPPPKRSSIKRTNKKRPDAPPPLPPSLSREPTYEYLTVASFDASIPDGVSFNENKKVEVLEKSPGGWWFVKIDSQEGWAPASYIEKREAMRPAAAPSRPKPPSLQKNNPVNSKINGSSSTKPITPSSRQSSLTTKNISHPILQKVSSVPSGKFDSSPAQRPLPPLPLTSGSSQASNTQDDTYEDINDSHSAKSAHAKVKAAASKNAPNSYENSSDCEGSGKVDFRSVLKSARSTKTSSDHTKPSSAPARPQIAFSGSAKTTAQGKANITVNKLGPNSLSTAKSKPAGFQKFGVQSTNSQTKDTGKSGKTDSGFSSSSTRPTSSASVRPSGLKKPGPLKSANAPPSLPVKPKPPSVASKPGFKNASSNDGVITDFRSVLRPTKSKNFNSSNSTRMGSKGTDMKKSWTPKEQQSKAPVIPKKPNNLRLKSSVSSKVKSFNEEPDGEESNSSSSSTGAVNSNSKPALKSVDKPVLRRFQSSNNSNGEQCVKKPVITVAHAHLEFHNQPDIHEVLAKRGSPDGQVDLKFENSDSPVPVIPPERKKKLLRKGSIANKVAEDSQTEKEFVIAISNYDGLEANEISFVSGDKAQVLDEAKHDWWYVKIDGKIGWAPSRLFRRASSSKSIGEHEHLTVNQVSENSERGYDSVYSEIEGEVGRPPFPANFVALAEFEAEEPAMVSLKVGDKVTVTQEANGGWWYATLMDGTGEGWVPSTYLELI